MPFVCLYTLLSFTSSFLSEIHSYIAAFAFPRASSFGSSREHTCLSNKKENCSMKSQRLTARLGAVLSLLGGALVLYGVFFLPMVLGEAGGSLGPTSEWTVANTFSLVGVVLLALPLVSVLFILGTSAASLFQELSPKIVTWRRRAAIAGLVIQGLVGFFMAVFYTFGLLFGAGLWLVLLGFLIMMVGTFLN
jgi:hypothetical protein